MAACAPEIPMIQLYPITARSVSCSGGSPRGRASARTLAAYAGLGHWRLGAADLEGRLELIVRQLAAELSACGWCVAEARHRWRRAFLPDAPLRELRAYQASAWFTERERAALALTEAVAGYTDSDPTAAEGALALARTHFGEVEIAHIVHLAAAEHFYNPVTGALGSDAQGGTGDAGCRDAMPWDAVARGIAVRGWL